MIADLRLPIADWSSIAQALTWQPENQLSHTQLFQLRCNDSR